MIGYIVDEEVINLKIYFYNRSRYDLTILDYNDDVRNCKNWKQLLVVIYDYIILANTGEI